jgi:VanZ family protein
MRRLFLWLPAALFMGVIFYSSSLPDPAPALTRVVLDKILHMSGYALLGILYCVALRGEGLSLTRVFVIAIFLASLYGASDEWHQSFTPGRTPDVEDWFADTAGGAAGAVAFAGVSAFNKASRPQHQLRR